MSALVEARKVLSSRASEPKAKMFGLSDDLRVIARALDELERRNGIVAEAYLLLYESVITARKSDHASDLEKRFKLHAAVVAEIGKYNDHAGVIARRIEHGKQCTCSTCAEESMRIARGTA